MPQHRIYEGFRRLDLEDRRIGKAITIRRVIAGGLAVLAFYYAVVLICLAIAPIHGGGL